MTQETTSNEEQQAQPVSEEGGLVDTQGELIENPSPRDYAVVAMAYRISQDDELSQKAFNFCIQSGNQMLTIEQYVDLNFKKLIKTFPDIQEEYISEVEAEAEESRRQLIQDRKNNVISARERQKQLRKQRRKSRR